MTPNSCTREGAFGLLNKPLDAKDIHRTLKKVHTLFQRGACARAHRALIHSLSLDVILSPRLILDFPKWKVKKYKNSVLKRRWDIAPVWKTAPNSAWYRASRLSTLLVKVASVGHMANIAHDLLRLTIFCWKLTAKDFRGLCRRIEHRCDVQLNLVELQFKQLPENALLGKLNANPRTQILEYMGNPPHRRERNVLKYGVRHRPNNIGTAEILLNVKRRWK